MTKLDTVTLTQIINDCFDFSMDGRLTEAEQDQFRAHGKRLRGHLISMLTIRFDEGTPALLQANTELQKVNDQLSDDAAALQKVTDTLNNIAQLAASLDKLLNVAATFF